VRPTRRAKTISRAAGHCGAAYRFFRPLPPPPRPLLHRLDEGEERRRGAAGPRLHLGVELGGEEEGVAGDLGDLHPVPVLPRKDHPLLLDPGDVLGVHLVAVAVPLDDSKGAVDLLGEGPLPEDRLVVPEAHRRPHILHPLLLGEDGDDGVRRLPELPGARAVQAEDVAAELDDGKLHPKAYPQIGDAVLAGEPDRRHLATGPPGAEAAGDQDPVEVG